MSRIAVNPYFPKLAEFVFPHLPVEEIRKKLTAIDNIRDFQHKVMHQANLRIIEESVSQFTYSGMERVDPSRNYLYVSNHRYHA